MNSKQRRQMQRKVYRDWANTIAADEYQGKFFSDHIIDNSSFVDFIFLGQHKDKEVVWYACISTANSDYLESVSKIALKRSYVKLPASAGYDPFYTIPSNVKGKLRMYEMVDDPNFPDEPALNEARNKLHANQIINILNNREHPMPRWHIEADETYKYGIGLNITVDKNFINISDIYEFVESFNTHGLNIYANKDLTPSALNTLELGVELSEDKNRIVKITNS